MKLSSRAKIKKKIKWFDDDDEEEVGNIKLRSEKRM